MIEWIKYLWGCDWSKENYIFDSCHVLSQHESEILNDLDQRISFLSAQRFDQRLASQISTEIKKIILKESLWDQGSFQWIIQKKLYSLPFKKIFSRTLNRIIDVLAAIFPNFLIQIIEDHFYFY